ncbi:putative dehydrogenase [Caldalkalibacillus uzonensis]|uniref:Dehydrogenase n=1 Tax=Caldalkalibacillus uzonensis TaxID=353224 RepID=A0ABU0CQD7_9BACI|nr:Gfo/Idh/MocA family oxidoreductase [Caldalkalibacillus uzonensis]MDQ0338618.1 putative dehydrogenase [Caldalkalibacillus uzonensis]
MIKVAIIGSGGISLPHIEAYLQFPEHCRLAALCDVYPDKARQRAQQYHLHVDIYDNYKKLVERPDIDLVSICTPPYTHAQIAIDFLNAGKHVLVEKPMASSLAECDAMNEAAFRNKKVLSVISQNRFRQSVMKVKGVLEANLIGPVVHAQVDSLWWRGSSYYDVWWRGTWEKEGGGCTLNHAVHHIDLFLWLKGMPSEVVAVMSNVAHHNAEVEDISIAICLYPDGSLAQITSSVVHHGEEQQLVFQGQYARVSIPWQLCAYKARENGFPARDFELERKIRQTYNELPDLQYEGHIGQIYDVLLAVDGQKDVLVNGCQGRRTLEMITAIYQAASTGRPVKLPLSADSPFYTREGILAQAKYFNTK